MFTRASFSDHKSAPESFRYQNFTLCSPHTHCPVSPPCSHALTNCNILGALVVFLPFPFLNLSSGKDRPRGRLRNTPTKLILHPSQLYFTLVVKKKKWDPLWDWSDAEMSISWSKGSEVFPPSCQAALQSGRKKVWEMASLAACVYSKLRWDRRSNHCYSCNNDIS